MSKADDEIEALEQTNSAAEALDQMTDDLADYIVSHDGNADHVDYAALHHYADMDTSYDNNVDAGYARSLIDSKYMDKVLDVRIGEKPDGWGDNRIKIVIGEPRTGLRAVYISTAGMTQAYVDAPDNVIVDDIARHVNDIDSRPRPDRARQVEVKVNDIGIDIPRFDD